jgi:hypothetical protein
MAAVRGYRQILAHPAQPDVMDALAALYRVMGNAAESRHCAVQSATRRLMRLGQLPEAACAPALQHEPVPRDPAKALAPARFDMASRPHGDSATLPGSALRADTARPKRATGSKRSIARAGERNSSMLPCRKPMQCRVTAIAALRRARQQRRSMRACPIQRHR